MHIIHLSLSLITEKNNDNTFFSRMTQSTLQGNSLLTVITRHTNACKNVLIFDKRDKSLNNQLQIISFLLFRKDILYFMKKK